MSHVSASAVPYRVKKICLCLCQLQMHDYDNIRQILLWNCFTLFWAHSTNRHISDDSSRELICKQWWSVILASSLTLNPDFFPFPQQGVHLAQASFELQAFGSQFILDLTLNKWVLLSCCFTVCSDSQRPHTLMTCICLSWLLLCQTIDVLCLCQSNAHALMGIQSLSSVLLEAKFLRWDPFPFTFIELPCK